MQLQHKTRTPTPTTTQHTDTDCNNDTRHNTDCNYNTTQGRRLQQRHRTPTATTHYTDCTNDTRHRLQQRHMTQTATTTHETQTATTTHDTDTDCNYHRRHGLTSAVARADCTSSAVTCDWLRDTRPARRAAPTDLLSRPTQHTLDIYIH